MGLGGGEPRVAVIAPLVGLIVAIACAMAHRLNRVTVKCKPHQDIVAQAHNFLNHVGLMRIVVQAARVGRLMTVPNHGDGYAQTIVMSGAHGKKLPQEQYAETGPWTQEFVWEGLLIHARA